jgi:CBS domain-containing protein
MPDMTREPAIAFANQLRAARLAALGDAEAFDGIVHVVERLGSYLSKELLGDKGEYGTLYRYAGKLKDLAANSGMALKTPDQFRNLLTPFETLYKLVTVARNDALHQGAFARHLTKHVIELAIILEDALRTHMNLVVTDFMVRNPVCAEPWQPVGFIRQQMLANSYSYLPVLCRKGDWRVVSDAAVAIFLGSARERGDRTKLLASTLEEAEQASVPLKLTPAKFVDEQTPLDDALKRLTEPPILLVQNPDGTGLLGILTAFDLL